jgi:serine/threonine protein kinase
MESQRIFIKNIGVGSQASVDKYRLVAENKEVAIKKPFVTIDGDISPSTLKELNIFQKLRNCPTIIQLIDVDIVGLDINIIMPIYQFTLTHLINNETLNFRVNHFSEISNQLLNALYNLYYSGVIHLDIKPDNILCNIENDQVKIVLADFGLAVQLPCEFSYRYIKHPISGSPIYMAPEMLSEDSYYNDKVDIWSSGLTLLEYLIDEYVTEPSEELFNKYDDFTAIKEQIYLISINGHIDVVRILQNHLSPEELSLIPTDLLIKMLQINPIDRSHITDLYDGVACNKTYSLERGEILNHKLIPYYYNSVFSVLNIGKTLKVNPVICYLSIDVLERYLTKYDVKNLFELTLYAVSSLSLNYKLYENEDLDYNIIVEGFGNIFTVKDLLLAQFTFFQRLNYLLTSCDTDEFVHAINVITTKNLKRYGILKINNDIIYPALHKMYLNIQKDGLYPGNLFPFELIDYFVRDMYY